MYVKIEPSGCCKRKGTVQIRFSMYLEPGDYGYEKHYVQVPIVPLGGYSGKRTKEGLPVNQADYDNWLVLLPKVWQNNPFHNHFIFVSPNTPDQEIMNIAKDSLREAYSKWTTGLKLDLKRYAVFPTSISPALKMEVDARVQQIKTITAVVKL